MHTVSLQTQMRSSSQDSKLCIVCLRVQCLKGRCDSQSVGPTALSVFSKVILVFGANDLNAVQVELIKTKGLRAGRMQHNP